MVGNVIQNILGKKTKRDRYSKNVNIVQLSNKKMFCRKHGAQLDWDGSGWFCPVGYQNDENCLTDEETNY